MEELVGTLKVLFLGIAFIFFVGFRVHDDEVRFMSVVGRMFNKIKEFVSKNQRLVVGFGLLIVSVSLLIMSMYIDKKSIAFWAFLGISIILAGVALFFIKKHGHTLSKFVIALGAGIYASSILSLAFNGIIIFIYGAKSSRLISIKDFLVSMVLPMCTSVLGFFLGDDEETNRKNDSRFEEDKSKEDETEVKDTNKKDDTEKTEDKEEKAKKPFYKKLWFWLIIIIIATIAYISYIIYRLIHVPKNVNYIVKLATPFVALIAAIGAIISYFIKNESEKEDRENTRKIQVHSEAQWRKRLFDLVEKEELTKNDVIYFLSFFNSNNPTNDIDKLLMEICYTILVNDNKSGKIDKLFKTIKRFNVKDNKLNKQDKVSVKTIGDIKKKYVSRFPLYMTLDKQLLFRSAINLLLKRDWYLQINKE